MRKTVVPVSVPAEVLTLVSVETPVPGLVEAHVAPEEKQPETLETPEPTSYRLEIPSSRAISEIWSSLTALLMILGLNPPKISSPSTHTERSLQSIFRIPGFPGVACEGSVHVDFIERRSETILQVVVSLPAGRVTTFLTPYKVMRASTVTFNMLSHEDRAFGMQTDRVPTDRRSQLFEVCDFVALALLCSLSELHGRLILSRCQVGERLQGQIQQVQDLKKGYLKEIEKRSGNLLVVGGHLNTVLGLVWGRAMELARQRMATSTAMVQWTPFAQRMSTMEGTAITVKMIRRELDRISVHARRIIPPTLELLPDVVSNLSDSEDLVGLRFADPEGLQRLVESMLEVPIVSVPQSTISAMMAAEPGAMGSMLEQLKREACSVILQPLSLSRPRLREDLVKPLRERTLARNQPSITHLQCAVEAIDFGVDHVRGVVDLIRNLSNAKVLESCVRTTEPYTLDQAFAERESFTPTPPPPTPAPPKPAPPTPVRSSPTPPPVRISTHLFGTPIMSDHGFRADQAPNPDLQLEIDQLRELYSDAIIASWDAYNSRNPHKIHAAIDAWAVAESRYRSSSAIRFIQKRPNQSYYLSGL